MVYCSKQINENFISTSFPYFCVSRVCYAYFKNINFERKNDDMRPELTPEWRFF